MTVLFYSLLGPATTGARGSSMVVGRVSMVNNAVQIDPQEFRVWLLSIKERRGHKLNPKEGASYLKLLPKVFDGAYLHAVLENEESSGGTKRSGGTERG